MRCDHVQLQLDDMLDGEISASKEEALNQHLAHCEQCQNAVDNEKRFRQNLRGLPVPPASAGFAERALATARIQNSVTRRNGFITGFSGAIAASFALWLLVTSFIPAIQDNTQIRGVTLVMHEQKMVNLAFNVPNDLANVTLSMQLPKNAEIVGHPGKQTLSWQASLKQGQNILPLPIIMHGIEGGELVATIQHDGQKKSFRIKLDVNSPTDLPKA